MIRISALAATLMLGAALPAAAGGMPALSLPHLTWPADTVDENLSTKGCVAPATQSAPACSPSGQ